MGRFLLALFAIPFLTPAAAPTLEPRPLEGQLMRPFVRNGDQWTTNMECEWDLVQTHAAGGPGGEEKKEEKGGVSVLRGQAQEVSIKLSREDAFDTEVLETKEDIASKVRRDYTRSSLKTRIRPTKGEGVDKQEETPLHQATLVLERDGDATKLVSGGGSLSEKWKSGLSVDVVTALFLPKGRVEEGGEWTIEGKTLEGFLRQQISKESDIRDVAGKLKISFQGMKEEKGKKIAEMSIQGDLTLTWAIGGSEGAKEPSSMPLKQTLAIKGTLRFDPASSRSTSFVLDGKLDPKEGPDSAQAPASLHGKMRFTLAVEEKSLPTGEAMRLLPRFYKGDVTSRTQKMNFDLAFDEISVKVNGKAVETGQMPDQEFKISQTTKTTDEILEASEGKVQKLRREFHDVSFEMEGPMPEKENPMEELSGKIVLIERDGEEIVAKVEGGGQVDDKLLRRMNFGDEFRVFLPDEEVKRGSTWNPDEKKVTEIFSEAMGAKGDSDEEGGGLDIKEMLKHVNMTLDCKLASISDEEGVQKATIALKASFDIEITQDSLPAKQREAMKGVELEVMVKGKLEGEFIFDLKAGKPIRFGLSGPIEFEMKIQHSNPEAELEIEQNMKASGKIELEEQYSKGRTTK